MKTDLFLLTANTQMWVAQDIYWNAETQLDMVPNHRAFSAAQKSSKLPDESRTPEFKLNCICGVKGKQCLLTPVAPFEILAVFFFC